MITLSPERERELAEALAEAFTEEDLEYKVAEALQVPRLARSSARDIRERSSALVSWAHGEGRTEDLLRAALHSNPSNTRLRQLHEAVGLLPASSAALLEAMRNVLGTISENRWLRGLLEAQRQVCGIRVKPDARQTLMSGFLVGPDTVMTSRAAVADPGEFGADTELAFEDVSLGLHGSEPVAVTTADVYVLRLERELGREVVQASANVSTRARGWVSPQTVTPAPGSAVVVVQQTPDGIRVVADPHGFTGTEGDTARYRTSTHRGSLGAPVFDEQWRLLGIHVGGGRPWAPIDDNYGQSVESILRGLHANGHGWDQSRGIYRTAAAKPPKALSAAGELDDAIRGLGSSLIGADDDVWSDEVEELELPEAERWAWVEAAAAHATFDPTTLVPNGAASAGTRVALLLESRQVGDHWVVNDRLRKAALKRLAGRGELAAARAKNPDDPADVLDRTLGELIAARPLRPDDLRDPDALRALLTVVDWLDGAVAALPEPQGLRSALERATLLAPFRHLTRGFFAGREQELVRLAAYVADGQDLPLFLHSAGGMGKSALLAHFVLENAERDPMEAATWRPFVYLDFDRPELDAVDLAGVLLAVVRQLGPQVPAIADGAQAVLARHASARRAGRAPRSKRRRRGESLATRLARKDLVEIFDDVTRLLGMSATTAPIVLILDTLEEVQFASPDAVGPLVKLVGDLRQRVPSLRPVLAGRIPVEMGVEPMELLALSPAASAALLGNELPPELARKTALVTRLAEIVGGNPLSLRLAAEVVRREARNANRVIEELDDELKDRVGDAIVQGRLYERILGHLHDDQVARIANPGLALRKITWELIRDVLAEPCKLGVIDEPAARVLFDKLAKEVALVRRGRKSDELELRPELRRIIRDDLARDTRREKQRIAIHAAAVEFYAMRSDIADRAEEIYHRLARGEDPEQVDKRWLPGVEDFLRDAVGELPARSNVYLANRVGGMADEEQLGSALPIDWEYYASKKASDLLLFGQPQRALDLLAQRSERLPASKLHYVESIARRMLPTPDLIEAERAAKRGVAAARVSANSDDLREALEELVLVRRLRGDTAGVLRGLAELVNLGEVLGDDLVLLESNVAGLEAVVLSGEREVGLDAMILSGEREQFTDAAVRVFSRLPDELIAKAPELSRRVAAQVGAFDPATLQRVIRVVGTGSLDRDAAKDLHGILAEWQKRDPEIGAFVPDASKSSWEIAGVLRHLAGTRQMDRHAAAAVAHWLVPVVTPGISRVEPLSGDDQGFESLESEELGFGRAAADD